MADLSYYQVLFNDSANPCCFIDAETNEMVFMNRAMCKLLNFFQEYQGKNAEEILKKLELSADILNHHPLEEGVLLESNLYSGVLDRYFRVNHTLISIQGRKINLCKYFVNPSYIHQELSFDEAMTRCLEILKSNDTDRMLQSFLELLGNFYKCKKSYVFHFNQENHVLTNKYSWIAPGEERVVAEVMNQIPKKVLLRYLEEESQDGILNIHHNHQEFSQNSPESHLLNNHNVDNIVLSTVKNHQGEITGFIGVSKFEDVEMDYRLLRGVTNFIEESFNRRAMEGELKLLSDFDPLTGLGSRQHYARVFADFHRKAPPQMGVVFINLDGLRKTNEFHGYEKGDQQLKETARFVQNFFQEQFFRISGDEFVCFVPDVTEEAFQQQVDLLYEQQKELADFSFSVGHTWNQGNYHLGKMITDADTMMYINKQEYYHENHTEIGGVPRDVLDDLLGAMGKREFMVYLQPKVALSTEEVVGAEALIRRMDTKTGKMVFPDQFIPLYEKNSIIRHVDLFVLDKVCEILVEWGKNHRQIPISVNFSRVTLLEHGIVDTITAVCDKYNLPHHLIIIEITERIGLIENDVASDLIDTLKERGFKISLDDFGCAYSNIVTLAQIEFDEVKLDKSLVDHLLTNSKNKVIVENMLRMCNSFPNTETLAEGIEEAGQAEILREYGCTNVQGYFYSRPIPNEEFFQKFIVNSLKVGEIQEKT